MTRANLFSAVFFLLKAVFYGVFWKVAAWGTRGQGTPQHLWDYFSSASFCVASCPASFAGFSFFTCSYIRFASRGWLEF